MSALTLIQHSLSLHCFELMMSDPLPSTFSLCPLSLSLSFLQSLSISNLLSCSSPVSLSFQPLSCWMSWEPCLGGFYGPVAFLVLVMCIYFLCTFIQLKRLPERKYELRAMTEEQQRLASTESGYLCHGDCGGDSCPTHASGLSVLANEH